MQTPPTVADPGSVEDLARDIRAGALSPVDLVQRYLDRIEAVDGRLEAWREVDAKGALAAARTLAQEAQIGKIRGPLHGVPVGVKDIIDVAGLPTRCNSQSRADIAPALADAEIVAALRVAGAIVLGKTHTTEFALRDVSPARNPHNPAHTPGGSSSGSGAAVAAGMVPVALGTQTAASVNRPAAYCGIAAFKPSTRLIPGGGVEPLSYLYDTVGFYGSRVADAAAVFEAICPTHARRAPPAPESLNIVVLRDPLIDNSDGEILRALAAAAERIAGAGHKVTRRASPVAFSGLLESHRQTMIYEISRIRRAFLDRPQGAIGPKLLDTIRQGLTISDDAYLEARRALDAWRDEFFAAFAGTDAILWPATPKTAPKGLDWTGDASFIAPWTALGGPVVTMPAGKSASGMPIGCLLAGMPGSDFAFAATARRLAEAAEDNDSVF
ncbi:MAG: Glutamyl-tRNA(Gln) amidotransferase subunit A [Alphaproteobacteria bacterium MarineAlpha10_Bin3]|nr:MAG: Glutamyl-tRNA(Gln) amidotransferase subunit A [Alphaproteobacteria bacterium MarineAlpha10_Bin3]PPR74922.1 MAG: Glutamyl-tRNA(Gln) amidotransferase subunit A [Alphaproteobacteria bacterium MarineAlpha4_Bin1]